MPLRIAMWSGPRNISTAMMRAWENRSDTTVCDEPLYAFYLKKTGIRHPGADEIVAKCETDWPRVVAELTGPVPGGVAIYYQKHMAHHLLPEVGRDWLRELEHVFLIRDPREMLLSLSKVTPDAGLEATGLPQQLELFDELRDRGERIPPVLDAKDVLQDPEGLLRKLCEALDVSFEPEMLAWPSGPRETDGMWALHWYDSVERSTGFEPWRPREGELSDELEHVLEQCVPLYQELHDHRLTA